MMNNCFTLDIKSLCSDFENKGTADNDQTVPTPLTHSLLGFIDSTNTFISITQSRLKHFSDPLMLPNSPYMYFTTMNAKFVKLVDRFPIYMYKTVFAALR